MNLTTQYVMDNGYDYFGNAAEDTLVFFVRDEDAPYVEPVSDNDDSDIVNQSKDTINGQSKNSFASVPDANVYDDEFSQPMPPMAQKDAKQTEVGLSSREAGLRN